ncbi:hypothetical protein [Azospirillum sp. A23]|uniref:hypothetical protein n=1 Tax=Azospirillum sp. A23 TaxID=3160608 RepID=UPI0036F23B28
MTLDPVKLVILSASRGFLARSFGTADYDEIDRHLLDIMQDRAAPPPLLLDWAQAVVEAESQRH